MIPGLATKNIRRFSVSLSYLDLVELDIPTRLEFAKNLIRDTRKMGRLAFRMEYIEERQVGRGIIHAGMVCDTIYVGRRAIKKQKEMRKLRKSLRDSNGSTLS